MTTPSSNVGADASHKSVPEWAEYMRSLGRNVSFSVQPSALEPTGDLWTVSVGVGSEAYSLGQGSTLEEALAELAPVRLAGAA